MATGWQKSFKASVRHNRRMGLQADLKQAIQCGDIGSDADIKVLARRYETTQKRVRQLLEEQKQ